MYYLESPDILPVEVQKSLYPSLFLAGGISGCPDWQSEMVKNLELTDFVVMNPRRKDFNVRDPNAAFNQIRWEHDHLRAADMISFWFPKETLCPITLYELGAWSMTDKPIFVGVHPEYQRKVDVELQTEFRRYEVEVVYSLEDLAEQIIEY